MIHPAISHYENKPRHFRFIFAFSDNYLLQISVYSFPACCLPMLYTDKTLPLSFFCPLLFFLRNISMLYHPFINLCLCSSLQFIPVKFFDAFCKHIILFFCSLFYFSPLIFHSLIISLIQLISVCDPACHISW